MDTSNADNPFESRDVELLEDTEAAELVAQKNLDDDIRSKITHREFLGCGVIGSVRGVSYGTWKGEAACLVLLSFNFRSGKSTLRLKNAEIHIDFQVDPKAITNSNSTNKGPVLRNFSPRKIFGVPHTEKREWKYEFGFRSNMQHVPLSATATIGGGSFYTKEHRLKIIGREWPKEQDAHQVIWTIHEADKTEYGIPDEVNLGIVVGYTGPFQAVVEVFATLGIGLKVRGPPWSKDAPLLFNTITVKGEPVRTTEFEKLVDEDWKQMAPYEEEWRDAVAAV